jgi:ADP-dependent NAD(P)H-hydrate dehydratase / NAD(P)H-hydrate epimerase
MALEDCALLTVSEMAMADRLTTEAGRPGSELMENAGRAVAEAAHAARGGGRVAVLCGPGNNGGDGFVAARYLEEQGHAVTLFLLGALETLKGDAAEAARRWTKGDKARVRALEASQIGAPDLVIDALYGAGLSRPVEGLAAAAIEHVNGLAGAHVVAVDMPSGIHGDTGQALGAAIRARETVTFFRPKPGHFLMPGRAHAGHLHVADIGIAPPVLGRIGPKGFENGPALWDAQRPRPSATGHKYDRGHAVVVSGGAFATGAARLAARGALRAGAGLVTVASPPEALAVNAAHLTAIMLRGFTGEAGLAEILADKRRNALAMGPGLGVGPETQGLVRAAQGAGVFLVLDADALTSFAERPAALFLNARGLMVLTPHEGEFKRLFPGLLEEAGNRLAAARRAAQRANAVVVLKGPDTVIAEPDGRAAINANAPPSLATAGSGDVLAGIIAGLGAQGMPPFEAAACGVWLHGAAAAGFGPGLIAEDIAEMLPRVFGALSAGNPHDSAV